MTQEKVLEQFYLSSPKPYEKKIFTVGFAVAQHSRKIVTKIDGVVETTNTVNQGDFIVTGTKGERYVMSPENFDKRFVVTHLNSNFTGTAQTLPVKILAVQSQTTFDFIAPRGENMTCKEGDYLVSPVTSEEVYSVDQEVFLNTYQSLL